MLKNSFYGLLAQGYSYASLSEGTEKQESNPEILHTERIVGPLTGVIKNGISPEQCMEGINNMYDSYGEPVPSWVSLDFIRKVQERMIALIGEWNGTPFGKTMKLQFEVLV